MSATGRRDAPSLKLERSLQAQGHRLIAGVDEVGRGSWAGPVVAAAVILPLHDRAALKALRDVRDSKQLDAQQREQLNVVILRTSLSVGFGWCCHHVVDEAGLGYANRRAMLRAIENLTMTPDALLIDHLRLSESALPQLSVPRGDARSLSIAAASIVAKVFRDHHMVRRDVRFPGYGFAQHKGYGTHAHWEALQARGPSPIHRRSFRPVALVCP